MGSPAYAAWAANATGPIAPIASAVHPVTAAANYQVAGSPYPQTMAQRAPMINLGKYTTPFAALYGRIATSAGQR